MKQKLYKKTNIVLFINFNKINKKHLLLVKNKNSNKLKFLKYFFNKNNPLKLKNFYNTNKTFKNYLKFLQIISKKIKIHKKIFNNCNKLTKYFEKKNLFFLKQPNFNKLKAFYSKYINLLKINQLNHDKILNLFLKKLIFVIYKFLQKNKYLKLIFKQVDCSIIVNKEQKQQLLKNTLNLKKFQNHNIFKNVPNFLFNLLNKKLNLAILISNFLANQLSTLKNFQDFNKFLNFFITNIKQYLLKLKQFNKIEIKINGNITKKQRSVSKTFIINKKVNKLQINNKLNYNNSVSFTKRGTIGIKVWIIYEKWA